MQIAKVMDKMRSTQVDFGIVHRWDGGWEVQIGDGQPTYEYKKHKFRDFGKAVMDLAEAMCRHYHKSEFAKWFKMEKVKDARTKDKKMSKVRKRSTAKSV